MTATVLGAQVQSLIVRFTSAVIAAEILTRLNLRPYDQARVLTRRHDVSSY